MAILYLITLLFSLVFPALAVDWRPVSAEERSQSKPKLDPAADAEALFWDVFIEDRANGGDVQTVLNHYVRIKVFTERGKEQQSTVEIPRVGRRNIHDIAGRTIKPDGTIIELKKDAIFDRELAKTKGLKLRGKTFVLPNVEVGDIVEYRWRETRDGELVNYQRLQMQRDLPMWTVTYHLKPLVHPLFPYAMRSMAFQCQHPPFAREPNGFFAVTMNNIPAFRYEPDMPPEDEIKSWILIYYEEDKRLDPVKFWKELGKSDFQNYKSLIKADGLVKRTAQEIIASAKSPAEQLQLIDRYCRTQIRNTSSRTSGMTAEQKKAIKENHNPSDTLKQKAGTATDVTFLFAALAQGAGFDARMARVPDRSDTYFAPQRTTTYFMRNFDVAVEVDGKWKFYDPQTSLLEPGSLRWEEEGAQALVSDPKEGFFTLTQYLDATRSLRKRVGRFKLLEDGTLEGQVTYQYTGHVARGQRLRLEEMSASQREDDWKESLVNRLSTAQMSKFHIDHLDIDGSPLTVTHAVSIPGYATRTGKRLLLQPAFFERNLNARFVETTRKYPIAFDYPWSEVDEISIDLPEGWQLDQPTTPGDFSIANVGKHESRLRYVTTDNRLLFDRKFEWGYEMRLLYPVEAYTKLKAVFEQIHTMDNHILTLKPKAAANAN